MHQKLGTIQVISFLCFLFLLKERQVVYRSLIRREMCIKARETCNFCDVLDFYCWTFSKAANLIELLVTERHSPSSSKDSKPRNDPSFYVSTNWKFMKEIYYFLVKMVIFFQFITKPISFLNKLTKRTYI